MRQLLALLFLCLFSCVFISGQVRAEDKDCPIKVGTTYEDWDGKGLGKNGAEVKTVYDGSDDYGWDCVLTMSTLWAQQQEEYSKDDKGHKEDSDEADEAYRIAYEAATALGDVNLAKTAYDAKVVANTNLQTQMAKDHEAQRQEITQQSNDLVSTLPDGPEKAAVQAAVNSVLGLNQNSTPDQIAAAYAALQAMNCDALFQENSVEWGACNVLKNSLSAEMAVIMDGLVALCPTMDCVDRIKDICAQLKGASGWACSNMANVPTDFDTVRKTVGIKETKICTTDPRFNNQVDANKDGQADLDVFGKPQTTQIIEKILNDITLKVIGSIDGAVEKLYTSIVEDPSYKLAVNACLSLFVIFYAISFMFGIVQVSAVDMVLRLIKIALIFALISPGGWDFFYNYAGKFFIDGTNELINFMTGIASEMFTGPPTTSPVGHEVLHDQSPLLVLRDSLLKIFSIKMGVALVALAFSGFYGLVQAFFLMLGIFFYTRTFLMGVWIFLMSIIVKALLFALAPIFMVFFLFTKTRYLFEGWLSQLISYSLQPIFLFMFLGFYSMLMTAAITEVLNVNLCWSTMHLGDALTEFWRFVDDQGNEIGTTLMEDAALNQEITSNAYPMSVVNILLFALISFVAWGASGITVQIAEELASGMSLQKMRGALQTYFGSWWSKGKGTVIDKATSFLNPFSNK